jgi:hypothetical protein
MHYHMLSLLVVSSITYMNTYNPSKHKNQISRMQCLVHVENEFH